MSELELPEIKVSYEKRLDDKGRIIRDDNGNIVYVVSVYGLGKYKFTQEAWQELIGDEKDKNDPTKVIGILERYEELARNNKQRLSKRELDSLKFQIELWFREQANKGTVIKNEQRR